MKAARRETPGGFVSSLRTWRVHHNQSGGGEVEHQLAAMLEIDRDPIADGGLDLA